MQLAESLGLPHIVDVAASTGVLMLAQQWPSSRCTALCQWHCDVWSYKCATGPAGGHETPGPVGHHVAMNHALHVLHVVQNGLHGARHLSAVFAGQRSCPGIRGKHVYVAEEIPGAILSLSVLAAVHQVTL